jgi:hypothetical protein
MRNRSILKHVKHALSGVIFFLIGLTLSFQNCSRFESDESQKADFLSTQRVFDASRSNQVNDHDSDTTAGTNETPILSPNATPVDRPLEVPVVTVCSDRLTSMLGDNVVSSDSLTLDFVDDSGKVACLYHSETLRSKLVDLRLLQIKDLAKTCPSLSAGFYNLSLKSPKSGNLLQKVKYVGGKFDFGNIFGIADSHMQANYQVRVFVGEHGILTAEPADQTSGDRPVVIYKGASPLASVYTEQVDKNGCNYSVSPLLLQLGDGHGTAKPVELSAPNLGKMFDILGETSLPIQYAKELISWFTAESSSREFFVTLPDKLGQVNGINELFGNTTRGPDGRFADNGYLALEKYDGRIDTGGYDQRARDRRIDFKDEVFSKLRLWADDNHDAIAQSSELHSLQELKVESIDLDYDPTYLETDRYGNETRFKSIARTVDGKMHLVYDLWFVVGK